MSLNGHCTPRLSRGFRTLAGELATMPAREKQLLAMSLSRLLLSDRALPASRVPRGLDFHEKPSELCQTEKSRERLP